MVWNPKTPKPQNPWSQINFYIHLYFQWLKTLKARESKIWQPCSSRTYQSHKSTHSQNQFQKSFQVLSSTINKLVSLKSQFPSQLLKNFRAHFYSHQHKIQICRSESQRQLLLYWRKTQTGWKQVAMNLNQSQHNLLQRKLIQAGSIMRIIRNKKKHQEQSHQRR